MTLPLDPWRTKIAVFACGCACAYMSASTRRAVRISTASVLTWLLRWGSLFFVSRRDRPPCRLQVNILPSQGHDFTAALCGHESQSERRTHCRGHVLTRLPERPRFVVTQYPVAGLLLVFLQSDAGIVETISSSRAYENNLLINACVQVRFDRGGDGGEQSLDVSSRDVLHRGVPPRLQHVPMEASLVFRPAAFMLFRPREVQSFTSPPSSPPSSAPVSAWRDRRCRRLGAGISRTRTGLR